MALTPRGSTLRFLKKHRGITENPPNSNCDNRPNASDKRWGIRKAQLAAAGGATWLLGTPWCGEWARWALEHGGVKGLSSRLASVALIEDDAKARRAPFFGWAQPADWRHVLRGDLVVLFGRGVHVEVVRGFKRVAGTVVVITEGGNTSSGSVGSQSNGGGSYRRERPLAHVYGFARVDYPGGKVRGLIDNAAMLFARRARALPTSKVDDAPSSDEALVDVLSDSTDPAAIEFLNELR